MSLLREPDTIGGDDHAPNPAAASIAFTNPANGTATAAAGAAPAAATGGGCPMGFSSSATAAAAAAAGGIRPKRGKDPVHYHHYLQLDKVLGAQAPKSLETDGVLAHDEMLFIVIHQTYELWFKQILHELDSARLLFSAPKIDEKNMLTIVQRFHRIVEILKLLVSQLRILETMTPLSFLDFREYLFPASGFQSFQFRQIENKLGLSRGKRMKYAREEYDAALQAEQRATIRAQEQEPSLFDLIDRWLARTPFLRSTDGWDFWAAYQASVQAMFAKDRNDIKADREDLQKARLGDIAHTEKIFADFFDPNKYAEYIAQGRMRLSYQSAQAALMINTFQEEPIFQVPFQILTSLLDIDELMTNWRHAHAQMVFRMLGVKIGTGGSSGYHYLKATASQHKIFEDFSNLSMFLIPRYYAPVMPKALTDKIRFNYEHPAFLAPQTNTASPAKTDAKTPADTATAAGATATAADATAATTAAAAIAAATPATPVKAPAAAAGGAFASPTPLMVCPVTGAVAGATAKK